MTLVNEFHHNPQVLSTRAGPCNAFESDSSETKHFFGLISFSDTTENSNGVHTVSRVSTNPTGHHIRKETALSEACNSH